MLDVATGLVRICLETAHSAWLSSLYEELKKGQVVHHHEACLRPNNDQR
jgi:hypothetical protein